MSIFSSANFTPFLQTNVPFQGVTIGQKAQVQIPVGQTYLYHLLQCTVSGAAATKAQILAGISYVSLKVNGIEAYHLTGAQIVFLADYYRGTRNSGAGVVGASGWLPIFLERPWMNTNPAMRGPAWGMVGQNSYQMEVLLTSGGAIDGLALFNVVDPVANAWGRHVEFRTVNHSFASTGQDRIIDLPHADTKNPWDCLLAVHLELPSGINKGEISNLTVKAEGVEIINAPVPMIEDYYKFATDDRDPSLCPQYLSIDFMARNWQSGQLPDTMLTLEVIPTWTAAPGTYNIVLEVLTGDPGTTSSGTAPAVASAPGAARKK